MSRPAASKVTRMKVVNTETDIAVLQVQYKNLDNKVEELRTDMREVRDSIQETSENTHTLIKQFQADNIKAHKEMSMEISGLQKWRWMLMGAGVALGALGWPVVASLFGIGA